MNIRPRWHRKSRLYRHLHPKGKHRAGPLWRNFRVLRGGSWLNNPSNLRSAYRNNNTPDNRNNNIGFRCVWVEDSSPKTEQDGVKPGGSGLPGRCQEYSLTVVPAPVR